MQRLDDGAGTAVTVRVTVFGSAGGAVDPGASHSSRAAALHEIEPGLDVVAGGAGIIARRQKIDIAGPALIDPDQGAPTPIAFMVRFVSDYPAAVARMAS
jgi:hypothetical protein